ncbi:hypothetical protein HanPSC8_Chr13g0560571 [Helianthus annuus]|nr:hypothetical protein HanPSC8_Chr13g0560571 [Helianthus annuus]
MPLTPKRQARHAWVTEYKSLGHIYNLQITKINYRQEHATMSISLRYGVLQHTNKQADKDNIDSDDISHINR